MSHLLDAALAAAARGWHVFPLRPHDKRPAFPDHTAATCRRTDPRCVGGHQGWEQRATTDPDRIRRAWSARPYNVGIACGPSGLLVVDLDQPKAGKPRPAVWTDRGATCGADVFALICADAGHPVPDHTRTVYTTGGGTHLYFHQPPGVGLRNTNSDNGGGLGWLIDTRGHGGYVVAPGCVVDGKPYTLARDGDPGDLPDWLVARLRPAPLPPPGPVRVQLAAGGDRKGRYVAAAVRRQLTHLAGAAQGQRNTALYVSAVAFGQLVAGGALAEHDARVLLEDAAGQLRLSQAESVRTIASGMRAGAKRPRQVAA
ncbi:hypothetical protein GCM10010124_26650 [Pilimelia terevasa]|uniref:DNA primase/polymerase bifunctional N-terminal domain-containing protein n=1 Tax=Pilimelia terevasa TaxID=53372 RepID=A0A8J3FKB4_9ACTN|nr:bifunctional DNA primase/polymerase [Pilimelia terevasa]GGK32528.1 hypothetical protein GCM10010124_26650 [Pilimelia terevasa]